MKIIRSLKIQISKIKLKITDTIWKKRPALRIFKACFLPIFILATSPISQSFSAENSSFQLSKTDIKLYQKAFNYLDKNKWKNAILTARKAKDQSLIKVIYWSYFRDPKSKATFEEITQFLNKNPTWPLQVTLSQRAENKINDETDSQLILNWFQNHTPYTSRGAIHYAKLLVETGEIDKAKKIIRNLWRSSHMPSANAKLIIQKYRKWITKRDHEERLEYLLWTGKTSAAKRQLKYVSKDLQKLANARILLRQRAGGVDAAIKKVPKKLRRHPGLIYERLLWRTKKNRYEDALELLNTPSIEKEYHKLWWKERGKLARWALRNGRVEEAYILASNHSAVDGYAAADAEWLSGWIALRFLNDPETALNHFNNMRKKVNFPVSLSRAWYWIGRAYRKLAFTKNANRAFRIAAQYDHRFYGQLAMAEVNLTSNQQRYLISTHQPSTINEFFVDYRPTKNLDEDLLSVVFKLSQIGENAFVKRYLQSMILDARSKKEFKNLARASHLIKRPDLAVYAARKADQKHVVLSDLGYPIFEINDSDFLESPIIQSIIRQESGFYTNAKSHAGALGLMQLMPTTAKRVAKRNRVKYSKTKLTKDPYYNVRLGQSYLGDLVSRFEGILPMAFAGYNAGPSRVNRWVKNHGDPRDSVSLPKISKHSSFTKITGYDGEPQIYELIDWIELIPFTETRNYVQRVSENLIIYRQKFGERNVTLNFNSLTHMVSNLNRNSN